MDSLKSFGTKTNDYAVKLLKELINTESVNPPGNELNMCRVFEKELTGTGVETVIQEKGTRGNFIATLKGRDSSKSIVLNGHLDTVPFSDPKLWKVHPLSGEIIDGKMYGRGTSDMKSGLAAQFVAFKTLVDEGITPGITVKFIGTYDEESSGAGAALINETGYLSDAVAIVIGEPTNNKISISSKGTLWLEIEVLGKTSHAAYPTEGINAVDIMLELYDLLKASIKGPTDEVLGESTVAMTLINAGIKTNMIPDKCNAAFDLRTVPGVSHDEVLRELDALIEMIEKKSVGAKITYNIKNNRKPLSVGKDNETVQSLLKSIEKSTTPAFAGTNFFSDGSIFVEYGDIPMLLFGPGLSELAHQPDEFVEIDAYLKAVDVYTDFLKNL